MRISQVSGFKHTRGAALVIALLLMVVMTLLAVAGMNSAALEFVMAGNDQFHENAFQASETGIQVAIAAATYNPDAPPSVVAGNVPNSLTDTYSANIVPELGGVAQPALWGSSWNSFATYHFEIQSTGNSLRTSTALHNQGIAVVSPNGSSWSGNGALN
jgi:type IV pilus assembly protein PilX